MKKKWIAGCVFLGVGAAAVIIVPAAVIATQTQVSSNNNNSKPSTPSTQIPSTVPEDDNWSDVTLPTQTYENEQSYQQNQDATYQIPQSTGSMVTDLAYTTYGTQDQYLSSDEADQENFLDHIQDTFLFTGGSDVYSDFNKLGTAKNFIGLFEENVRWTYTYHAANQIPETYSTIGRFCFDTSKPGQTLADINNDWTNKVSKFDPQNVIYIVGQEDIGSTSTVVDSTTLSNYETQLKTFILNGLKFRNNTSTVQIIKHWKVASTYSNATIFNENVDQYNQAVDKVVSEIGSSDPEAVTRILVVNPNSGTVPYAGGSTMINFDPSVNPTWFDSDGISLSRIGGNYLAFLLYYSGNPEFQSGLTNTDGQKSTWKASQWVDYSQTLTNAVPLDWSYDKSKNNENLKVATAADSTASGTYLMSVVCPDGSSGDQVSYQIEFKDAGLIIKGTATLSNSLGFTIHTIGAYDTTTVSPITNEDYTNNYVLTVFNKDGQPYNKYEGNLVSGAAVTTTQTLTAAQQRFMNEFNDPSKPLTWCFLGDSTDHGAVYTQGFDDLAKVTEKSVKQDWGRWDDTFINVAMSGDFTNRAVDPYLIQSRITKYKPDVLSITLGVSDGVNVSYTTEDGKTVLQQSQTDEQQFQNNFKTLVEAAKAANPNVVIVVNAIPPTNYVTSSQDRRNIPPTYNAYLEDLFGSANSPYSDYVIYNPNSYDVIDQLYTEYPYIINDGLFYGSDSLHPAADAHLIKAKVFLDALGVDTQNSYLDQYFLEKFTKFTGTTGTNAKSIPNITLANAGNKVVPNLSSFISTFHSDFNPDLNIGQFFISLTNSTSDLTYWLLTGYNPTSNNYLIPYVNSGTYTEDFWATTQEAISTGTEYSVAPASTSTYTQS